MRILYFSVRECWPLTSGGPLRDYHLARELARRASVTYLGLRSLHDPPSVPPPEGSMESCIVVDRDPAYSRGNIIRGLLGPIPVNVLNCYTERATQELRRLLDEETFDVVQVEGVHLQPYLRVIRASRSRPAIVGDWHDIPSEVIWRYRETSPGAARRLYAYRAAQLLEKLEVRFLRECDTYCVASEREREKLLRLVPTAPIDVVGNGVDVAFYSAAEIDEACRHAGIDPNAPRRDLLFVGNMTYHANIDAVIRFAEEVWPSVRERHPEYRFVIAGRSPVPAVAALAQRPGVVVTGTVDDVRSYYRGAVAVVVPLRVGSGTRLKILEAMASGVPVISTALGAEGLEVKAGRDLLLAETPQETLDAIEEVAASTDRWHALAEAGLEVVRTRFDWAILGEKLFQIHTRVAARRA